MLERFDYQTYGRLLEKLAEGRVNLCFRDFPMMGALDRYFLLRHDVEVDPAPALEMARLEADLGFQATYFILLSVPYFNLMTAQHANFARKLVRLGHEVGLHYDVKVLATMQKGDLPRALDLHSELLGRMAGQPVRSIAMHMPSLHGDDPFRFDPRFVNAYDPPFTDRALYLSDSAGAWRDQAIEVLEEGPIPPRVTLLTHPHFWARNSVDRVTRWKQHHLRHVQFMQHDLECRKAIWASHQGVVEHDRRYFMVEEALY